ncbi:MAG: hypothetical protein ABUK01_06510 [Leptospirales bacterium]
MKKRLLILLILIFPFTGTQLLAGEFKITGTNLSNSGLYFYTSGNGTLNADSTGIYATVDTLQLQIGGFTIKKNQSWQNLKITTTGAGSYDIEIRSKAGKVIHSQSGLTSTVSINLSSISLLSEGTNFQMYLTLNADSLMVTQIKATYSGNSVICYPAPYKAGSGDLTIAYDLPANGKVTIKIYDNGGKLVKTILNESYQSAKSTRFNNAPYWNGKSSTGRLVSTGVYTVVVDVRFLTSAYSDYVSYFRLLIIR